jgi:hypothetical protein
MFVALLSAYVLMPLSITAWDTFRWWNSYPKPLLIGVLGLVAGLLSAALLLALIMPAYNRVGISGVAVAGADPPWWLKSPLIGLGAGLLVLFVVHSLEMWCIREAAARLAADSRI